MKKIIIVVISFILLMSLNLNAAKPSSSAEKSVWSYDGETGPQQWGKLDTEYESCSSGKMQSPINISNNFLLAGNELNIQYHSSSLNKRMAVLNNNGSVLIKDHHGIKIQFNDSSIQNIEFKNKKFRLIQLHFHSPAENVVQNEIYQMEIHFVHRSDDGEMLVLAVLVQRGIENHAIGNIIETTTNSKYLKYVDITELIPAKLDHYYYRGSLTTPPCTENLQWLVMSMPITASVSQINAMRNIIGGNNARPVQDLNNRVIYFATR